MKRTAYTYLTLICIAAFALNFAACGGKQVGSGTGGGPNDSLSSPEFSLDGVMYTLPVHFSELEANGWSSYDTENDYRSPYEFTLNPGDSDFWVLTNGNQDFGLFFSNGRKGERFANSLSLCFGGAFT